MIKTHKSAAAIIVFCICFAMISLFGIRTFAELNSAQAEADPDMLVSGEYSYKLAEDGTAVYYGTENAAGAVEVPAQIEGLDVTVIGERAFYKNEQITEVTIPDSVAEIAPEAFAYCEALAQIHWGTGLKSISKSAFGRCNSLTELVFPEGLEKIANDTFEFCENITSITFPDSLKSLGTSCFVDCHALQEVNFGKGLETIGVNPFKQCESLLELNIPGELNWLQIKDHVLINTEKQAIVWFPIGLGIEEYSVPEGITEILDRAFSNCNLKKVILPEGLTRIGNHAFATSEVLEEVVCPGTLKSIGNMSFTSCKKLKTINLPEGLEKIDSKAFYHCVELEYTIPSTVTDLAEDAFD